MSNPTQTALDETISRIKASYPMLWIQSDEHNRVCISLQRRLQEENEKIQNYINGLTQKGEPIPPGVKPYKIYIWDVINGLLDPTDGSTLMPIILGTSISATPAYRHVLAWGNQIPEVPIDTNAIILVLGFNNFLSMTTDIARTRAALLQIIRPPISKITAGETEHVLEGLQDENNSRCVIFLSPRTESPILSSDLLPYIEPIDFPRPNQSELEEIIRVQMDGNTTPEGKPVLEDNNLVDICASEILGSTTFQAENAISLTYLKHKKLDPMELRLQYKKITEMHPAIKLANFEETWDNLVGFDVYKRFTEALFTPGKIQRNLKGYLFVGVPGGGKSHAAKATGNKLRWKTLILNLGRVLQKHVGNSEESMEILLKFLNACGSSIVFMDEMEKALGGMGQGGDSGISGRILEQLLIWMSDHPIGPFLIGTANDLNNKLPPELLREGRWNLIWYVPPPNEIQRVQLFDMYLGACEIKGDTKALAERTPDWTGAEIKGLAEKAETLLTIVPAEEDAIEAAFSLTRPLCKKDPEGFKARLDAAQLMGVNVNEEEDSPLLLQASPTTYLNSRKRTIL